MAYSCLPALKKESMLKTDFHTSKKPIMQEDKREHGFLMFNMTR